MKRQALANKHLWSIAAAILLVTFAVPALALAAGSRHHNPQAASGSAATPTVNSTLPATSTVKSTLTAA